MGLLNDIFGNEDDTGKETGDENAKLLLRKEELDIDKSNVQKGEVEFSKEIISEQKTVDVPVKREEVVIERRSLNNEQSDSPITEEAETIRIPVSEEIVNVNKRTVVTGEVSAYKRNVSDTKHIDETLKREEVLVNKIGNPDVVDSVITDHQ
ncbi:YsnF/AvaK domain-containing protein [Desulfosporosinus meridiei]|uniref:Conserved domain protein, TIGR02271+C111 n=1 Tax=Desulfosporosinus meridiei (strain ATCC BAA-275 / DSM 13257 / KCTC 12902 / NCIMB 13706 / S10) TaxID=768704 RepID=J7IP22_DESMD|nr:YsnF/AvaK domain-containing protein [Desulfosporosinus meridiei]AFQ43335.1 conserved domain protein, TIGR02271+C111 [Desulfosporosinus meridiei DSM 13257]